MEGRCGIFENSLWILGRGLLGRSAARRPGNPWLGTRVSTMPDTDAHPLAPDVPASGKPPRTYLAAAVAVSALCFLPLGLIAVLYGWRSARAVSMGDPDRARRLGRVARRWVVVTLVVGLLVDAALVAVFAVLGAFSS